MRGERSWFAIDFKSFEIPLEEVGGKLLGRILERGRGFSSWINFWELSCVIFWMVWKLVAWMKMEALQQSLSGKW